MEERVTAMSKIILVVEDDDLNMKVFREMLAARGFICLEARDGITAIRMAFDQKPDLILMDLQLPDISGLDVTRMLKSVKGLREIPIIMVTAFAACGDAELARNCGCDGYIAKPIALNNLYDMIDLHTEACPQQMN